VVKTYGGVYLDPDIEPYRAIDGLIGSAEAFAVPRTRPAGCFESAIFGAEHEHPWVRELDAGLSGCDPGTSLSMGADYLTATLRSHPEVYRTRPGAIVFEYPEPDPWVAIRQGKVVLPPPERSAPRVGEYARHHWSSHWFAESFKRISP
jgi:mannosyltransferase OCH1-like enzyme